jgi:hypothetical protein
MSNNSGSGLVLKAIGFLVVAFVAIFIVKMVLGAIFGFLSFLFAVALILAIGYAVIWAVRKL